MQNGWVSFRHMKIKNKLSILFALVIAVTFTFTFLVQQYAFSIYDKQLYDKSAQVLNLSSSAIESELERIEQMSYQIIADTQLQSHLLGIKTIDSEYDRVILYKRVGDRILSYAGPESSILSMHIYDSRGVEHKIGNLTTIDPAKMTQMEELAKEGKGESRWVFPDGRDTALISVREIRSYRSENFDLQHLGTLIIRINIDRVIQETASQTGDLIVVSGDRSIYPEQPAVNPAEIQGSMRSGNGYFTQTFHSQTYFISHFRSPDTGWTYLSITPYNEIFEQVIFIKQLVIAVFVAIFLLVILIGIRFSRSLTKPIDNLIGRMKLVEKGNFEEANLLTPDSAPKTMDEMGLLQRTFRLMVERINTLITENYSNRLIIKETEFRALQAQINPHFLYNTLESINWMAKVNRQTQISEMVEALGLLFRSSVSLKKPLLTLAEEIQIVRSYITIQRIRFEERLSFTMDVPDKFMNASIPKLTLQPLLENAIQYALESMIGICEIRVVALEAGDEVQIIVEDNGPGMPEDTLDLLKDGSLKTRGNGIGLLNIDDRIRLSFGEGFGLRIQSEQGKGTRIIVRLPNETED